MKDTFSNSEDNNLSSYSMLSIEEQRTFPGFGKINKEEASEAISSLYQLGSGPSVKKMPGGHF